MVNSIVEAARRRPPKDSERDYASIAAVGNSPVTDSWRKHWSGSWLPSLRLLYSESCVPLTAAMAREHFDLVYALRNLRGPEFSAVVRKAFTKFAFRWISSMSAVEANSPEASSKPPAAT